MIFDKLENAHFYYDFGSSSPNASELGKKFKTAFDFLKNTDLKNQQCGKYTISDDIYYNLQEYQTKENAPYEIHRQYIDIQYVVKGEEKMGFANIDSFSASENYNLEKDVTFGILKDSGKNDSFVIVKEGFFTIFTPEDAHAPALLINKPAAVKKVIVKIKR